MRLATRASMQLMASNARTGLGMWLANALLVTCVWWRAKPSTPQTNPAVSTLHSHKLRPLITIHVGKVKGVNTPMLISSKVGQFHAQTSKIRITLEGTTLVFACPHGRIRHVCHYHVPVTIQVTIDKAPCCTFMLGQIAERALLQGVFEQSSICQALPIPTFWAKH